MAQYVFYQQSISATTTKDTYTDLNNGKGFGGFITNDALTSATTLGVAISYDFGTTFGQTIVVKQNEKITLDGLGAITQVRVVAGGAVDYRLLVSNNKANVG